MRGKLCRSGSVVSRLRLIPAYAGKTMRCLAFVGMYRAHPRVCGENSAPQLNSFVRTGSSPRMRGKHQYMRLAILNCRLIPAYAGKTYICSQGDGLRPAHPRVCGENSRRAVPNLTTPGSSPRMRGKLFLGVVFTRARGLIPAYAGKTSLSLSARTRTRAHPRVCGENNS